MRIFPKDLEGFITNEMKDSFCAKEHSDFIPPFCYHKLFHTLSSMDTFLDETNHSIITV